MTRSVLSGLLLVCSLVGCGTVSGPPSVRPVPAATGRPLDESEVARLGFAFPPAGYRAQAVEVGCAHACALTASGAVECWGRNQFGELGDGTRVDRRVPAPVLGLPPVAEIAVGCAHACARTASGEVWCWGGGDLGEIGDGARAGYRSTPVRVPEVDASAIDASGMSTCARSVTAETRCWGSMAWPDGSFEVAPSPRALGPAASSNVLTSRSTRACALVSVDPEAGDGRGGVVCWGHREQRGNDTPPFEAPTPVPSLAGVLDLDGNGLFYCAADAAAAFCWGSSLSMMTGSEPNVPTRFELGASAELAVGDGFLCGRAGSGGTSETRCMSFDVEVSLVDRSGTAYALEREPRSIPSLRGLTAIDAGSPATCGIDAAGLVQCAVLYAVPRPAAPPS